MKNPIAFILTISGEPASQVEWCLFHFRRCYHDAPLRVIVDGKMPVELHSEYSNLFDRFKVGGYYFDDERKKGIEHGPDWWIRWLQLAYADAAHNGCMWVAKFDADTLFSRQLELVCTRADVQGSLMSRGAEDEHIQGGFQLIRTGFIDTLLGEFQSRRAFYLMPESWQMGAAEYFRKKGEMSTDYMLAAACHHLDADVLNNALVDSKAIGGQLYSKGAAITHPHKSQSMR